MKSVDVLVAVRNEEKSIPGFIKKFNQLVPVEVKANIIFLEDGSSDGTIKVLKESVAQNKNIHFISLENKYGQYAALTFGLLNSNSDAVITMDVDGGHPVETAVEMIRCFLNGYNMVQGHRIIYKRKKFYRTALSFLYNLFFYIIVGVNFFKQNVMFRLMDNATKEKFLRNKNWWHIFKTNFRSNDGIKTSYIQYEAPEREVGESKYGFFRLMRLSYKSFFALLSLRRLIMINIVLITFAVLLFISNLFIFFILITVSLILVNFSYHQIINHYPLGKLEVIDTSIPGLKNG